MANQVTFAEYALINGYIYTADQKDTVAEAMAISNGYIIAIGNYESISPYLNENTKIIDLDGKTVLPGIIDSHLHPFWGGLQLSGCNLNYASLTIPETLNIIQNHLDQDILTGENDWLQVRAWLRQGMIPSGTDITRADLDSLKTKRPVILFSNDCHTLVANSRALALFGLDENTPDPTDGQIGRNPDGSLNGILEDAPAMRAFDSIPGINLEQAVVIAENVQNVLNQQGVTTIMDARALPLQFDAFKILSDQNKLTVRLFGAREITPDDAPTLESIPSAVSNMKAFAQKYSDTTWTPKPGIKICHAKFFIDGVLHMPIMTASLLSPYLENKGTKETPNWQPSDRYGDLYYPQEIINTLVTEVSKLGFHPHMHTVADGAVEAALDAIEVMRKEVKTDIRPALAHNELVAPHQFKRFKDLKTIASLSFQWAGMTQELIDDDTKIIGKERVEHLEPIGKFIDAGVTVSFGSDWPIDPLNEWYDFKVAMTRKISEPNAPRLDNDRNLTAIETLRAATIEAAYALGSEDTLGSLEVGKFADCIITDRNPFTISAEELEHTKILTTFVGGKIVYQCQ